VKKGRSFLVLEPVQNPSYFLSSAALSRVELSPQDLYEEVAAPARRLQKARFNALGIAFHKVEHGLDHPGRGEDLSVVCDALFGLYVIHGHIISGDAFSWSLRAYDEISGARSDRLY
jgi:hypothetical protein